VAKFVFFEQIVSLFYTKVFNEKPKQDYPVSTQLFITFSSGYLAGIICAIVSHPADTILSKISNQKTNEALTQSVKKIYSEIGFKGLWKGLSYRILMIGTLTGFQWWIYDSYKSAVGLQTSGGSKK
jgi:solute carrier family 25 phosphate transporter 3